MLHPVEGQSQRSPLGKGTSVPLPGDKSPGPDWIYLQLHQQFSRCQSEWIRKADLELPLLLMPPTSRPHSTSSHAQTSSWSTLFPPSTNSSPPMLDAASMSRHMIMPCTSSACSKWAQTCFTAHSQHSWASAKDLHGLKLHLGLCLECRGIPRAFRAQGNTWHLPVSWQWAIPAASWRHFGGLSQAGEIAWLASESAGIPITSPVRKLLVYLCVFSAPGWVKSDWGSIWAICALSLCRPGKRRLCLSLMPFHNRKAFS